LLFENLKAQIPEICQSAQESANFYFIIDLLKDLYHRSKMACRKKKVMVSLFNLSEVHPLGLAPVNFVRRKGW